MPLYSLGDVPKGSPGVVPTKDYNAPTPPHGTEDPMQKPGFLREAYEELVAVRKEISRLYADEMTRRNSGFSKDFSRYSAEELSVSGLERKADYHARLQKLEEREEALMRACSNYKHVASLGDAPAEEDESGEAANDADSGATSRVGLR